MLYLVGCTLFVNKSVPHVIVVFLNVFHDINQSGGFSYGATALVNMYEKLNYASKHKAKNLARYITLLEVIILIFIIVICFKFYMYYWLEFLLEFFNMCSFGSMIFSLELQILLLMRITMRENHVLVVGSVERHY